MTTTIMQVRSTGHGVKRLHDAYRMSNHHCDGRSGVVTEEGDDLQEEQPNAKARKLNIVPQGRAGVLQGLRADRRS